MNGKTSGQDVFLDIQETQRTVGKRLESMTQECSLSSGHCFRLHSAVAMVSSILEVDPSVPDAGLRHKLSGTCFTL